MTTCSQLDEVRQALTAGQWPQAAAPDLRAHAESCTRCAQEVLITTHLQQARTEAIASAEPPTPSLLWWRAQLRRRKSAVKRAGRPIAAAQVFAMIIVLVATAGLIAAHLPRLLDDTLSGQAAASLAAIRGDWGLTPLLLAITLITTLSGVVAYLATNRE